MTRVLVTGATGTLGRELVPRLRRAGYVVRAMTRSRAPDIARERLAWVTGDLRTGEGLAEAVAGVDAIVHAATDPAGGSRRVDHLGTRALLREAQRERVGHVVYPSIVGIRDIHLPYYRHKVLAEGAILEADVPYTILPATKFHPFVDRLLTTMHRLPVMLLPKNFEEQPVHAGEVAQRLVELLARGPAGVVDGFAGPEVLTYEAMAAAWLQRRGSNRRILRLPVPGRAAARWRSGATTLPGAEGGGLRWSQWLRQTSGP